MAEIVNTATVYKLYIEALDKVIHCPVLSTDQASMLMSVEWAGSLVKHSGFPVKVYRGHMELIEVPVQ